MPAASDADTAVHDDVNAKATARTAVRRHRRNFWLLIVLGYPVSLIIAVLCVDRARWHDGALSGYFVVIHRGSCAVGHAGVATSLGWWTPRTPVDHVSHGQFRLWSVGGWAVAAPLLAITMGLIVTSYVRLTIASIRLKRLFAQPRSARTTCEHCGYPRAGLGQESPCPECGNAPFVAVQ
jgi:hypothetical protein